MTPIKWGSAEDMIRHALKKHVTICEKGEAIREMYVTKAKNASSNAQLSIDNKCELLDEIRLLMEKENSLAENLVPLDEIKELYIKDIETETSWWARVRNSPYAIKAFMRPQDLWDGVPDNHKKIELSELSKILRCRYGQVQTG